MNAISFRSIGLTLVLFAVGNAWPAAVLRADDFSVSGTDKTIFVKGNEAEGISMGQAQPGGRFTGEWSARFKGYTLSGFETWRFGDGHTLTWFFEIEYSNKNLVSTGNFVVIDGTGRFEGATGSADYLRNGNGDSTGEFVLEGSVSLH